MFNKNVFTQKDPIADLVKPMLEAQAKAKMEELKGNQRVLDKNKNNKLDSQDFKILRGEKKVNEDEQVDESSPFDWKKPREPEVKGGSGVKAGRAYGGAAQKSKPEQETDDDKKKTKNEEVEQVSEMDKSQTPPGRDGGSSDPNAGPQGTAKPVTAKSFMRKAGSALHKALTGGSDKDQLDRLRKDMYKKEEVENIEERSLTSGEKAEMEKNVKGMKKNLAGFKARYGARAKSVMYATATKQAKKD